MLNNVHQHFGNRKKYDRKHLLIYCISLTVKDVKIDWINFEFLGPPSWGNFKAENFDLKESKPVSENSQSICPYTNYKNQQSLMWLHFIW